MHILLRSYKDIDDFVKSILKRNSKTVILQVGTKNIKKDKPKQVKQKLVKLVGEMNHPSTPK